MRKKRTKRRIFLETSGVIYILHGEQRMRAAVLEATSDGRIEVSNFIRMEYLRGVILNLIEFYFLIKESESVAAALIDWAQKFQVREIKIVMMSAQHWLIDHDDYQSKEKSLRRLGDGIVRLVYEFDETLDRRAKDHLKCELGRVYFPRRPFKESLLLDFYERFTAIQRSVPSCQLCSFKERQKRSLQSRGINLYGQEPIDKHKSNKGFVGQAKHLNVVAESKETLPRCRWCEQLGDSIIALHAPAKALLVTADRAFIAFGEILSRNVRLLPSLAELKRRHRQAQTASDPQMPSPNS